MGSATYRSIFLYVIITSVVGGISYMAYTSYVTTPKVGRRSEGKIRNATEAVTSAPKVSTPTGGQYEADWIPSSHQKRPGFKKAAYNGASSGGESAGEDVQSGNESKARRRKR